jgi:hypothetical protein
MGLINWEWKSQKPFKFANTFWHFVTINTFTIALQAIIGHWYYIGVVWISSL